MAKKSMIARLKKRDKKIALKSEKRKSLKQIISGAEASFDEALAADVKLQRLSRDSSPSRKTHSCRVCGRTRGVYRKFGLCRIDLRNLMMRGMIPGLRKASW